MRIDRALRAFRGKSLRTLFPHVHMKANTLPQTELLSFKQLEPYGLLCYIVAGPRRLDSLVAPNFSSN